ncbi:hypothetical protein B0H16DRAFT_1511860 [Mycena metata]|uniref:Uncharacterized protein n=1 Tax=Mycena metata TaxID=1033252 RepID=A0AAD7JWR5_9AGAR|nr:hypothetical protein B0H16DRAFT_1511860 [Mycena metata]
MLVTRSCSRRFPLRLRFPRSQSTMALAEHSRPRTMGVFEPPPMPDMSPEIERQLLLPLCKTVRGWHTKGTRIPKITFYHVPSPISHKGLDLLETAHANAAQHFAPLRFTLEVCPAPPPAETLREFVYSLGSGSLRDFLEPNAQRAAATPSFDALYKLVVADPLLLNAPLVYYDGSRVRVDYANLDKTRLFLGARGAEKVIEMLESLRRLSFGVSNLKLLQQLTNSRRTNPRKSRPGR